MTGIAGLPKLFPSLTAIVIAVPRPLLVRVLCWSTFGAIVAHGGKFRGWNVRLGQNWTFRSARAMSALPPKADIGTQSRNVRFVRRVQPIDATPSNLTREGGVRWRGLHGYGSRRSRGLSFGSAGRTVNVWRISLGRLRGGTRAVSIVSWLSMVALLRSRAGELRER